MWSLGVLGRVAGLAVLSAGLVSAGVVPSATASAHPGKSPSPGKCSPKASFLGFSDALDKTEFGGHTVAGLSAMSLDGHGRALALVDNVNDSPARFFDLSLQVRRSGLDVAARKVTTLKRPDGTPFNGLDFDGEGLVLERGGKTLLASSENEPTIRRFNRSDGRQLGELPVPGRFRVTPAGEAAVNGTFESLAATPDGRTVYAGMEDSLSTDSPGLNRILRYQGRSGGSYAPSAQFAYRTDPSLGLAELIALRDGGLLAMERGYTSGVGNTVRVYQVSTRGARDVSDVASLTSGPGVALQKRLLVDVVTCPPSGAIAKQAQPNPLLDNIEGMAWGGRTAGGRDVLYLIADDNSRATQITRLYALSVEVR
jgi:hypothetical protein